MPSNSKKFTKNSPTDKNQGHKPDNPEVQEFHYILELAAINATDLFRTLTITLLVDQSQKGGDEAKSKTCLLMRCVSIQAAASTSFVFDLAVVSEVKFSKENTTDNNADGVNRSPELTATSVPKRSRVNGFTLRDDAKLDYFFNYANSGGQFLTTAR